MLLDSHILIYAAQPAPRVTLAKTWLLVGEAGAGQRGAVLYSLIESCRRRKIDPYAERCPSGVAMTRHRGS